MHAAVEASDRPVGAGAQLEGLSKSVTMSTKVRVSLGNPGWSLTFMQSQRPWMAAGVVPKVQQSQGGEKARIDSGSCHQQV